MEWESSSLIGLFLSSVSGSSPPPAVMPPRLFFLNVWDDETKWNLIFSISLYYSLSLLAAKLHLDRLKRGPPGKWRFSAEAWWHQTGFLEEEVPLTSWRFILWARWAPVMRPHIETKFRIDVARLQSTWILLWLCCWIRPVSWGTQCRS